MKVTYIQSFFDGSTSDTKLRNLNITDDIIIDALKEMLYNSGSDIDSVSSILLEE